MKLCYQVATPDVAIADSVTAYQGPLDKTFGDIAAYGYDGVELMTTRPRQAQLGAGAPHRPGPGPGGGSGVHRRDLRSAGPELCRSRPRPPR